MGSEYDFIIWIVLLALVGLFTLVRKFIEKATSGEQGQKIDLGKAVQAQLSKYMKAIEGTSSMFPGTPPPREASTATEKGAPPPRPAPPKRPAPAVSKAAPPARARERKAVRRRPLIVAPSRPLSERTGEVLRVRGPRRRLTVVEVRKAIVLAEVLGPPMAERQDYRLF